jgi:sugar phosphate isomerase/epimerase
MPGTARVALPLAAHSFGAVHHLDLAATISALATAGFSIIELAATPPHLYTPNLTAADRAGIRTLLQSNRVACSSVTPTFGDLNLASLNRELRCLSVRQVLESIELAHDLEAPVVVVVPGRRHPLIPAPPAVALDLFRDSLETILRRAEGLGVVAGVENVPTGILDTGTQLIAFIAAYAPAAGIVYDCANGIAVEDPSAGVRAAATHLSLVHISDAGHDRWAHGRIGSGEVDFTAFSSALQEIGYSGTTVFELLGSPSPVQDLAEDARLLEAWGWSRAARPAEMRSTE